MAGDSSDTLIGKARLAFSQGFLDTNIWRIELRGQTNPAGPPARFIFSTLQDSSPQFSPDGRRIAFASNRSGTSEIWTHNGYRRVWFLAERGVYFSGQLAGHPAIVFLDFATGRV